MFVFPQWWAFENVFVPRDQTLSEGKNFGLHVTAPLKKHFVMGSAFLATKVRRFI
jgi:hypothetical protein